MDVGIGTETFYVQLQYQNGSHLCGGSILATYLIITAAHCFDKVDYRDVKVVAGRHPVRRFFQTYRNTQTLEIDEVIIHEGYVKKGYENDIALLVLSGNLSFSSDIASVLPARRLDFEDSAMVGGWLSVLENLELAGTFTQSVVTIFNNTVCGDKCGNGLFNQEDVTGRRLCASAEGVDETQMAWEPDFGGPLICVAKANQTKPLICGIVSVGQRECGDEEARTGLYVNVFSYYTWILDQSCYDRWRHRYQCPPGYFRCHNNFCVPKNSQSDGFDDCGDGSDEWLPMNCFGGCEKGSYPVKDAKPGEISYHIQLQYKNGSHFCGGTILSTHLVLTAAHCFDNLTCEDVQVVAGQHSANNNDETQQTVDIQKVIIHEDYIPESYENDIAILVLKHSLIFGKSASSAAIPTGNTDLEDSATVIGWGNLPDLKDPTAHILRKETVAIFNVTVCNEDKGDGYFDLTTDTRQLCTSSRAATGFSDASRGDAGAPLMCSHRNDKLKRYVCGIASAWENGGEREENSSLPGLYYVNVSSYYGWILNRTCLDRQQHDCPPDYFRCCNNLCVPLNSQCDGMNECGDNSDEKYCTNGVCALPDRCLSRHVQICPETPEMPVSTMMCKNMADMPEATILPDIAQGTAEDTMESVLTLSVPNNTTHFGKMLEFIYKSLGIYVHVRLD